MCAGCSCASSVLTCTAHFFSGRGRCAVTGSRVHARATPTPKGVTALPRPLQLPWTSHTRDPEPTALPRCAQSVTRLHNECCVRHPRADRMRAQTAVDGALSCCAGFGESQGSSRQRRSPSQASASASLKDHRGYAALRAKPMPPRVSRVIAATPLSEPSWSSRATQGSST